ncbi:DUF4942 domain-containing protein, partial [Escherichia coli]|nr:DUF4942 domain-containing protein [Escherichia coli]
SGSLSSQIKHSPGNPGRFIQSVQGKGRYEDEMFIIKYFKKGSAHITFKRLELIDRINDIIARHFPSVLSA